MTVILIMMENQINNQNSLLLILEIRRFHYKFKALKVFCFQKKKNKIIKTVNKMK
ncbi:hypothetical protein OIU79_009922 [Salix purpurea]|uniref:Uncharacterized protein n=1 Tax=Salix purpurea TaxID=77065 RepID=A0A9Q0QES6_SALPP|nr:hypothetical protein OIU79_009922 [Salix purpurea]